MPAVPSSLTVSDRKAPVSLTQYPVLLAISFSHLLNDTIQSLIPAIYPVLKAGFSLSFSQIGVIAVINNLTASLLQPAVGAFTDRRPQTYSLAVGMCFTLVGLFLLATMGSFSLILCAVAMIGVGSSIFHPESSRVAAMASGGKRGWAQSIFQLGGNAGSAAGPVLAALLVARQGRAGIAWAALLPLIGIPLLAKVGRWKRNHEAAKKAAPAAAYSGIAKHGVMVPMAILLLLIFSKYFYTAGMSSYLTFYLIDAFGFSVHDAQLYLALFLVSTAAGTLIGGPLGDRVGRKYVIWGSILGVAPFTLALPYANAFWVGVLIIPIGLILASAFSAILVYAHDLLPGKVGMVSGLFFGFAFGMGGLGSALLGVLADHAGIRTVFQVTAFLPLLGLLAAFLPNLRKLA